MGEERRGEHPGERDYEPPTIVTLGDVETFTVGDDTGSPTLDGASA